MFGINKQAFSIVELLIVLAIVSIMGATIIKGLRSGQDRQVREHFIQRLNTVTRFAREQAVMTGKMHRVFFDLKARYVHVERLEDIVKQGENKYVPVSGGYVSPTFHWQPSLVFKSFIINGIDEMSRAKAGEGTTKAWFYVVPSGFAQPVILNVSMTDSKRKKKEIGLVLNPFNAQFRVYDSFQK